MIPEDTLSAMILAERDKGNALLMEIDGLYTIPVSALVDQPADGILYDLNRLEEVALTLLPKDIQWVNNFAVALVIRELKNQITNNQKRLEDAIKIARNSQGHWSDGTIAAMLAVLDVSKENES